MTCTVVSNYDIVIKTNIPSFLISAETETKMPLKLAALLLMADLSSYWFGLSWVLFIVMSGL